MWALYPEELGGPCTSDWAYAIDLGYDAGYDAGYAAAPTPESNDAAVSEAVCTSVGGTWDGAACTTPPKCFLSGFCVYFGLEAPTGHLASKDDASEVSDECEEEWWDGYESCRVGSCTSGVLISGMCASS